MYHFFSDEQKLTEKLILLKLLSFSYAGESRWVCAARPIKVTKVRKKMGHACPSVCLSVCH